MKHLVLVPSLLLACYGSLQAAEKTFVGPRAHGMAGANVASTKDATAQFYNPGALGFFREGVGYSGSGDDKELSSADNNKLADRNFDMTIDLSIGYRLTGDLGDYLQDLADIDINALGNLNAGSGISTSELADIVNVLSIFTDLADDQNAFVITTSVGTNVRIKNMAIGARAFGRFVAHVSDIDTVNLGISFNNTAEYNTALEDVENNNSILPGGFAGYTPSNLSPQMQADLATAGFSPNAIDVLDYQIGETVNSGLLDPNDITDVTTLLENTMGVVSGALTGGDLDQNTTAVAMTGVGYVEVPVSYGHAFNDNLSVGVSPKFMIGRVYGANILVFDEDADQVIDNITEEYHDSETFSIDVGLMARVNNFQIGVTGTNLTSPEFEGFTGSNGFTFDDIKLDPQVTVGVAWIPNNNLTLEVDVDVLPTDNGTISYDTQYISVGAEYDFLSVLAVRAGAYQNMAESDIGPVLTAGLGINIALARLDIGASFSPEMVEYDGSEIPEEAAVSLGLMIKF